MINKKYAILLGSMSEVNKLEKDSITCLADK